MIQYDCVLLLNRLQLWPLAAPSVGSAVHPTDPSVGAVVFCFRALSFLSGTRCSRLIPGISCSCPRVGISPGSPGPFRWKWCRKPRYGRWCADRGWGVLASRSSQLTKKEVYVCLLTHVYTSTPRFIVLCRHCVFYKLKVYGNPVSSHSLATIFPTFAHFVFLCYVFQTFSSLLYLLW